MDEETRQYRQGVLTEIRVGAIAGAGYERSRYIDHACQVLESAEEITEYGLCRAHATWKNNSLVQVDAYSFSEGEGVLNLIVCDYSGDSDPEPLSTEDVRKQLQASFRFLEGSVQDRVADCWDESHEAHKLADAVFRFADGMNKARLYLVTDRELSPQLGKLPDLRLRGSKIEIHLWDIARQARAELSTKGREAIVIDFGEEYERGIPVLPTLTGEGAYRSYLCIMPGAVLADLYDRFGGRILEQNVRAFLGEGRKVNKGIRETLHHNPAMFFAFNNGLTATASTLTLDRTAEGDQVVTSVADFQVVNGGQTTASLFWAKKAGYDLSKVAVQMKLSQLPEEGFEELVHEIARCANAQNAVSASDLFAGHPYFKRLETLSRELLAPPSAAGETNTYWYFERTQGSYNVDLRRKRGLAAKTFELLHPKKQRLTKTDVARYEVTWQSAPHSVCAGAQKNTSAFASIISEDWKRNPELFDANYFKNLVARAILVKALDAAIPAQAWYPGSVLRQLTTYTISLIASRMHEKGLDIDYDAIWKRQKPTAAFVSEATRVAAQVLPLLQDIPAEQVRNRLVTEWAKREACWTRIQESSIRLSVDFISTLRPGRTIRRQRERWDQKAPELHRAGQFRRLHEWNKETRVLSQGESELVERAAIATTFSFRGFRLAKLKEAWVHAVASGFV